MRPHARHSFGSSFPLAYDYCYFLLAHVFICAFLICFDVDDLYPLPSPSDILVSTFIANLSLLSYRAYILPLDRTSFSRLCSRIPSSSFLTTGSCYLHTIPIMNARTLRCSPHFFSLAFHLLRTITSISRLSTLQLRLLHASHVSIFLSMCLISSAVPLPVSSNC